MRKSPVMRYKISKAAASFNEAHEAGRGDCNARMVLRSSSLRFVVIQAIDIFIRGCYL